MSYFFQFLFRVWSDLECLLAILKHFVSARDSKTEIVGLTFAFLFNCASMTQIYILRPLQVLSTVKQKLVKEHKQASETSQQ